MNRRIVSSRSLEHMLGLRRSGGQCVKCNAPAVDVLEEGFDLHAYCTDCRRKVWGFKDAAEKASVLGPDKQGKLF